MDSKKLYDLSFLNKVSDGDDAFISEMINTFLDTGTEYFDNANKYCQSKNFDALGKETHKFIPGVSFLGLKSLEKLLLFIEEYCKKSQNLEKIPELVTKAEEQTNLIIKQFKQDFNINK